MFKSFKSTRIFYHIAPKLYVAQKLHLHFQKLEFMTILTLCVPWCHLMMWLLVFLVEYAWEWLFLFSRLNTNENDCSCFPGWIRMRMIVLVFQVEYECDGFLHKNRDTVMEEQINILKAFTHTHQYWLIFILFKDKSLLISIVHYGKIILWKTGFL